LPEGVGTGTTENLQIIWPDENILGGMNVLRHIPNALTLINLMMGTMAIIALDNGRVETTLILIGICLLADILDGAIARALKINSGIGVQLDSLADVVSFGVLPSMMLFYMGSRYGGGSPDQVLVAVLASLNAVSAGLRLARFNVDERSRNFFWGLATPAGAMLVTGWLWAQHIDRDYGFGVADFPWLVVIITIFLVIAYQVGLRLPGLKSKKTGFAIAVLLGTTVAIGVFTIGPISIPLGIIIYFIIGLLNLAFKFY
jgi:CDP-diacylglycerol--serine O-phosphatidyltransferase